MKMFDLLESHRDALECWIADDETPPECWADTIGGIEFTMEEKARAYTAVILELEAEADAKKAASKRISEGAKSLEKRADFLRDRLKMAMEEIGKSEFKFAEFKVSIPKPRASLKIDDDSIVPDKFKTTATVISINNAALKQSLVDGESVDGAHLEYKTSLTIR